MPQWAEQLGMPDDDQWILNEAWLASYFEESSAHKSLYFMNL